MKIIDFDENPMLSGKTYENTFWPDAFCVPVTLHAPLDALHSVVAPLVRVRGVVNAQRE